jgi:lytic cellulose monooxygenase (C1-hydroxylating)
VLVLDRIRHYLLYINTSTVYMECAQINVTGGGSNKGANFVSFPGAYPANDPGIVINIYGAAGQPDNGGKAYTPPGPSVLQC